MGLLQVGSEFQSGKKLLPDFSPTKLLSSVMFISHRKYRKAIGVLSIISGAQTICCRLIILIDLREFPARETSKNRRVTVGTVSQQTMERERMIKIKMDIRMY